MAEVIEWKLYIIALAFLLVAVMVCYDERDAE